MAEQVEHHPNAHAVTRDPEFLKLVRRKNSISYSLTILMLAVFFGYAGILAWNPGVLAAPVGGATLGIPIGIGIIVFAWILTGLYVRWANTEYDNLINGIKSRVGRAEFEAGKETNQ
jgi:uncharacterized membrane protein (DUF485 family)